MAIPMSILILTTLLIIANSQSESYESSCLVQARLDGTKRADLSDSPFSTQQQQCIADYVAGVRHILPSYDLSQRRFGGSGRRGRHVGGAGAAKPLLGAGFGMTGTRSLALFGRQLGLRVHHFAPSPPPVHHFMLVQNCTEKGRIEHLNQLNFSKILRHGKDLLLDTPMAELFLDFYAASPGSKVILTLRDPERWAQSRSKLRGSSPLPVQSPCGPSFSSLSTKDAAKLFDLHQTLVRCMVPRDHLLELHMDLPKNSTRISQFLGVQSEFEVPFPRIGKFQKDTKRVRVKPVKPFKKPARHSSLQSQVVRSHPSGYRLGDRFAICITGQIRRLHLQTKIKRLIEPALAAGHNVEVYLVLDPRVDETSFIHRPAGEHIGKYTITEGSFSSLSETVDLFPSNLTVVFDPFMPKDYPVDPRYAALMEPATGPRYGLTVDEYHNLRSKVHMRQWEALDRCWQLILARDPEQPPKMAMRLRDDAAVMEEFVPPVSMPPGIHAARCESFHGMNDKGGIISGAAEVQKYFTQPLSLMRNNFSEVLAFQRNRTSLPFNPESVLFNSMAMSQVAIHNMTYYPILPISMMKARAHPKQAAKMCYLLLEGRLECCSGKLWQHVRVQAQDVSPNPEGFLCVSEA